MVVRFAPDPVRRFAVTVNECLEAAHRQESKRRQEERLTAPIHDIDGVISELEALQLQGRQLIPRSCQLRVRELAARHRLRLECTYQVDVTALMDRLYFVQQQFLSQKQELSQLAEPPP